MKKVLMVTAGLIAVQILGFSATILPGTNCILNAGGPCGIASFPTGFTAGSTFDGTPFWNNDSRDNPTHGGSRPASNSNIGDLLTGQGGFAGGTNYLGYTGAAGPVYYSGNNQNTNTLQAKDFAFLTTTATVIQITLLSLNGDAEKAGALGGSTIFGYYDIGGNHAVFTSGATALGTSFNVATTGTFGFYMTECPTGTGLAGSCTPTTFYTESGKNPGVETNFTHFAVFASTLSNFNNGNFFIGLEDRNGTDNIEGLGDFNDLVIQVSTIAIPEPATFGFMGIGLLSLAGIRRFQKK